MNRMTDLMNMIEARLATSMLNLPEELSMKIWPDKIIIPITLTIFSRYFPNKVRIFLDESKRKGDFYIIDEDLIDNVEILGIKDIAWDQFTESPTYLQTGGGYGYYDPVLYNYGADDIMMRQVRSDVISSLNLGLYPEFEPPNKVRIVSAGNSAMGIHYSRIPLDIFVKHPSNLMTIAPTKMNVFEDLATSDVASWLLERLKFFDQLDTTFGNIDIKLSTLENWAGKRDSIIEKLELAYVSPSNDNQAMIYSTY